MFKWIYKWTDKIREKVTTLSDKMSEKGQGIVEYALILAAVAFIAAYVLMGDSENNLKNTIDGAFGKAGSAIESAQTEP